jgi:hypothetical protein
VPGQVQVHVGVTGAGSGGRAGPHRQQGAVVVRPAVPAHRPQQLVAERLDVGGVGPPDVAHGAAQHVHAVLDRLVAALDQAVGEQQQHRALGDVDLDLDRTGRADAERWARVELDVLPTAVRVHEQRWQVPGAGQPQPAGARVEHAVQAGGQAGLLQEDIAASTSPRTAAGLSSASAQARTVARSCP